MVDAVFPLATRLLPIPASIFNHFNRTMVMSVLQITWEALLTLLFPVPPSSRLPIARTPSGTLPLTPVCFCLLLLLLSPCI